MKEKKPELEGGGERGRGRRRGEGEGEEEGRWGGQGPLKISETFNISF